MQRGIPFRKISLLLAGAIATICVGIPELHAGTLTDSADQSCSLQRSPFKVGTGAGLLTAEYIMAPAIASKVWWSAGINWGNPFDNIGEEEPYLEDDAWHFVSCALVTDLHYTVFDKYLGVKYPVFWASGLTLLTYTAVECIDALEKSGRWSFSIGDEISNSLGIGFWILKHYYPGIPVQVRVGVRKWDKVFDIGRGSAAIFDSYSQYRKEKADHYSILKVEAIGNFYRRFYGGVSLSKTEKPDSRNLWGATIGYDYRAKLNSMKTGWWNGTVSKLCEYVSPTFEFTFWFH